MALVVVFSLFSGGALSHRFALQMNLVGRVQQPVENAIGKRWIADVIVPVLEAAG